MSTAKTGGIVAASGNGAMAPAPITTDATPQEQQLVPPLITVPSTALYEGGAYKDLMYIAHNNWLQASSLIEVPFDATTDTVILNVPMYSEYLNNAIKMVILMHDRFFGSIDYRITMLGASTIIGGIEVGTTVVGLSAPTINDLRIIKGETVPANNTQVWTFTLGPVVAIDGVKRHFFTHSDESGVSFSDITNQDWSAFPHLVVLQNIPLQSNITASMSKLYLRIETKLNPDFTCALSQITRINTAVTALLATTPSSFSGRRGKKQLGEITTPNNVLALNGLSLGQVFNQSQIYLSTDGYYSVNAPTSTQSSYFGRMRINPTSVVTSYVDGNNKVTSNWNMYDYFREFDGTFTVSELNVDCASIIASVRNDFNNYLTVSWLNETHTVQAQTIYGVILIETTTTPGNFNLNNAQFIDQDTYEKMTYEDVMNFPSPFTADEAFSNIFLSYLESNISSETYSVQNLTGVTYVGSEIQVNSRYSVPNYDFDGVGGTSPWGTTGSTPNGLVRPCYLWKKDGLYHAITSSDMGTGMLNLQIGTTGAVITGTKSLTVAIPYRITTRLTTVDSANISLCSFSSKESYGSTLAPQTLWTNQISTDMYIYKEWDLTDFSYIYADYYTAPDISLYTKVPETARRLVATTYVPGSVAEALSSDGIPTVSSLSPVIFPTLAAHEVIHFQIVSPNNNQTIFTVVYDGTYNTFYFVPRDDNLPIYGVFNTRDAQNYIIKNAYRSTIGNIPTASLGTNFLSRIVSQSDLTSKRVLNGGKGPTLTTMTESLLQRIIRYT